MDNPGDLVLDPDSDPSGTPESDGLHEAAEAMALLAAELRADRPKVRDIDRRSRRQDVVLVLVGVMAALSGIVAFGNWQLSNTIKDCIDPTGHCYTESRARTSEVQKAIVAGQHEDAARIMNTVCVFISEHRLDPPPECDSVPAPPAPR